MASLITPNVLRQHVETDLGDPALQRIIDAEDSAIAERFGPIATAAEYRQGGVDQIYLTQRAASITAVDDNGTALDPADYELRGAYILYGVNGPFTGPVTIDYVPYDAAGSTARRIQGLIDLCKIRLAYSGYASQSNPDGSETPLTLAEAREQVFRAIAGRRRAWVFV